MPSKIHRLLFPASYREFYGQRLLLNLCRGLHLLFVGILIGGIFFNISNEFLQIWILGVLLSGLTMFFIESFSSCIYLFEIRGIVIVFKILVLSILTQLPDEYHFPVLVALLLFSSFFSHSPRSIRHASYMSDDFNKKYGLTEDRLNRS